MISYQWTNHSSLHESTCAYDPILHLYNRQHPPNRYKKSGNLKHVGTQCKTSWFTTTPEVRVHLLWVPRKLFWQLLTSTWPWNIYNSISRSTLLSRWWLYKLLFQDYHSHLSPNQNNAYIYIHIDMPICIYTYTKIYILYSSSQFPLYHDHNHESMIDTIK